MIMQSDNMNSHITVNNLIEHSLTDTQKCCIGAPLIYMVAECPDDMQAVAKAALIMFIILRMVQT